MKTNNCNCYVVTRNDFTGAFGVVRVFYDLIAARKFVCKEMDVIANALSLDGNNPVLDELKNGTFTVYIPDRDIFFDWNISVKPIG